MRVGFALVLLLNGAQTLDAAATLWSAPLLAREVRFFLDGFIVVTLAFLVSQFPSPLGGARGRRAALALWLAGMALWAVVALPAAVGVAEPVALVRGGQIVRYAGFLAAAALLATRLVPAAAREPEGPLRTQSLLVAAALGMGLVHLGVLSAFQFARTWAAPAAHALHAVFRGADAGMAFFAVAAVGQAAWAAAAGRRSDITALAALLAGALALGVYDAWAPNFGAPVVYPTNEFLSQSFRPLLVAVAMLRFDLFQVPSWARRPLLRLTAALFVVALFVLLVALFAGVPFMAPEPIQTTAPVLAFVALLVGLYPLRERLPRMLAEAEAAQPALERRARLDRYRLALEEARGGRAPDAQRLDRLRRSLGVTREEHDVLASLLQGHLVVPMAALYGAAGGDRVGGRYEVRRELGRGGHGRALLARDHVTGDEVVLKEVLRPWEQDAAERQKTLERELRVAEAVRSPHLARALGLVNEPWQTYLVREHVPGDDLHAQVERRGRLRPDEALRVVADVLAGLAALHCGGLLHLDVKPSNVIVRPDGRAVLIDQGTVEPATVSRDATRTRDGGGAGVTLKWAAPEQLVGGRVSARTDVYQAAGLLRFLLEGTPPAAAAAPGDRTLHEHPPATWPADAPAELWRVVARARAVDPEERPADADALRAALDAAAGGARRVFIAGT